MLHLDKNHWVHLFAKHKRRDLNDCKKDATTDSNDGTDSHAAPSFP